MRILLDEPVPRRLGTLLVGHEATTVPMSGWAGIKNGKLLTLAAAKFDAFVTTDRNIEFQQNLSALPIAVLVIVTKSNRMKDIGAFGPRNSQSAESSATKVTQKSRCLKRWSQ